MDQADTSFLNLSAKSQCRMNTFSKNLSPFGDLHLLRILIRIQLFLPAQIDIRKIRKILSIKQHRDYSLGNREWPYKNVRRLILAEQYLEEKGKEGYRTSNTRFSRRLSASSAPWA